MTKEKKVYGSMAAGVLTAEIIIALFVDDWLVRPLVGDALAVIFVYLGLRATLPIRVLPAVLLALSAATLVELGQRFGILRILGLETNQLARVILGSSYDTRDFLAYTVGAGCAVLGEALRKPSTGSLRLT